MISASAARRGGSARVTPLPWEVGDRRPTILRLVEWALCDQRADSSPVSGLSEIEARAAGYAWRGVSGDGVATIGRIGAVGCRIDVSGPARPVSHPVADLLAGLLETLRAEAEAAGAEEDERALEAVRFYGRRGTAPGGWAAPARWYQPADWAGDKPRTVRETVIRRCELTGRQRRHSVEYTPVMPVRSWDGIAAARVEWLRWRAGLGALRFHLQLHPLPFEMSAALPPLEPWHAADPLALRAAPAVQPGGTG